MHPETTRWGQPGHEPVHGLKTTRTDPESYSHDNDDLKAAPTQHHPSQSENQAIGSSAPSPDRSCSHNTDADQARFNRIICKRPPFTRLRGKTPLGPGLMSDARGT